MIAYKIINKLIIEKRLVISFAGDALVCIFWPVESSNSSEDYRLCRRATECGFILKDHCTDLLSAHMAVSYGELCFSFLGGYMNEWVYVVNGPCMTALATCIADAHQKELVMTADCFRTLDKVGGCFDLTYKELPVTGNFLISRVQRLENVSSRRLEAVLKAAAATGSMDDVTNERDDVDGDETGPQGQHEEIRSPKKIFYRDSPANAILKCCTHMLKFLPRPVVSTLSAGYFQPISELRTVTTVFLRLDSYSPEVHGRAACLQDFFRAAQVALAEAGGCLRQFLVDDKGCVLIALWGVPSASFGNNAARALHFAIEVCRAGHALDHQCSIGITTGSAFCGTIGSSVRQDYAAIGSKVNLAARLMMQAGGKILLDNSSHAALSTEMRDLLYALPPMQLKGSAMPTQAFCADWREMGSQWNQLSNTLPHHSDLPSNMEESDDFIDGDGLELGEGGGNGHGDVCDGKVTESANLHSSIVDTLNATMTRLMSFGCSSAQTTMGLSEETASSAEGTWDDKESSRPSSESLPLMQFIVVEGSQGMGKSEVCRYFRRLSLNNKVRNIALRARYEEVNAEYGVARRLFQEIVGADLQRCASRREIVLQLLQRAYPFLSVEDIITLKFPILKAALGLRWHLSLRHNSQSLPFSISHRMSCMMSVGQVLVDILKSLLTEDPLTIIIDDAHYCDKLTWNFLHSLSISVRFPVVALLAVRKSSLNELLCPSMSMMSPSLGSAPNSLNPKQTVHLPSGNIELSKIHRNFKSRGFKAMKTPVMVAVDSLLLHSAHANPYYKNIKIVLSPLTVDQLKAMLAMTWGSSIPITEELVSIMSTATSMNPFWCKCFAEFARDYGTDCLLNSDMLHDEGSPIDDEGATCTDGWSAENSQHLAHSSYFNSILANMMDKLSVTEQMVLKVGSVIGMKFSRSLLKCLLPDNVLCKMKLALRVLVRRRFIEQVPSAHDHIYAFQNSLIHDLVYKIIPPR